MHKNHYINSSLNIQIQSNNAFRVVSTAPPITISNPSQRQLCRFTALHQAFSIELDKNL